MLDLFVDIDNCPVFPQIARAATCHLLDVYVVTRDYLVVEPNVHLILAQEGDGAAREWIAAHISRGDICVTPETALARSCLSRGAVALAPNGCMWNPVLINAAIGAVTVGRAGDSRAFAQCLEITIAEMRAPGGRPGRRASGFDHFGLASAVRPFPRPRSAVG
jgi:uncharacterized protein YaiI (UPF0178 family)